MEAAPGREGDTPPLRVPAAAPPTVTGLREERPAGLPARAADADADADAAALPPACLDFELMAGSVCPR